MRQIEAPLELGDYSLVSPRAKEARDLGMHDGKWYRSPVPRATMKELSKRRDGPALRDTLAWLGALALAGIGGYLLWGTWLALPFFAAYGLLYSSAGEARWHECTHGTPFKTSWMNEVVYQISCFLSMRNPTVSRWSHSLHHTDTYIIGLDPEITSFRPPDLIRQFIAFFGLREFPLSVIDMFRHAAGVTTEQEKIFIPEGELWKVYLVARTWLAIYCVAIGASVYSHSILPMLFIGLPRMYGVWFIQLAALPQHAGLLDDVLDHRLDSRTYYMNPVGRFIYWNMNYHVEHHMFPTVPYYNLPKLHEVIKHDCPPAYPSMWATYREIVPTLIRQLKDPNHRVVRPLPGRNDGELEVAQRLAS